MPLEFKSPEDLLAKLRPGVDGVVLSVGPDQATYLPQVWKEIPSKEEFLGSLSRKAGLDEIGLEEPRGQGRDLPGRGVRGGEAVGSVG